MPGSCQGHQSMLLLTFPSCYLLTLCSVKPRLNKHASQNMHTVMLLESLLVSCQHLPTHSSMAFPVIPLPVQSAADPLSLLAKGAFCTALPFFPCDFCEVAPFLSLLCWFRSEDLVTFPPLQLACWVLYSI